jgi:microsomal dipeptidase-like Zn-dependent dipeptidase
LAKAEGKQKATALGMAGALGAVAAVLAIYGIGFAFATAAAGLSEALPLWLSLLIVTGVILVLFAIADSSFDQRARRRHRSRPAIEEAQQTIEALEAMSERTPEEIRMEIAAERHALDDDLSRLQSEIRSLAVFVAAGLVVVGLVSWRRGKRKGAETVWKVVK